MIRSTLLIIAVVSSFIALILCMMNYKNKLVYINLGKVYDEFQMTKEMNKEVDKIKYARQNVLDTLMDKIKRFSSQLDAEKSPSATNIKNFEIMQREYAYKENQFQSENQRTINDYYTKIMDRINQYVEEFGKEKHYSMIFGANGQGNIMYADDSKDISTEVINYLNSRYDGKK
jgi:outer membrane protein